MRRNFAPRRRVDILKTMDTRTTHPVARLIAAALLALPLVALAAPAPPQPCGADAGPDWPAQDGTLQVTVWQDQQIPAGWRPPPCAGWPDDPAVVLVAAVGRFHQPGGEQALLQRLGRVSGLAGLRYWSVSREDWATLISDAHAVTVTDEDARRPDYGVAELAPGTEHLYWQHEPTTSGSGIYALEVLQRAPGRLLIGGRNATDNRYFGITMLPAGGARSLYLFQRLDGDDWGYYQLVRLGEGRHQWLPVGPASYANRAIALFRWFADLPEQAVPVWKN